MSTFDQDNQVLVSLSEIIDSETNGIRNAKKGFIGIKNKIYEYSNSKFLFTEEFLKIFNPEDVFHAQAKVENEKAKELLELSKIICKKIDETIIKPIECHEKLLTDANSTKQQLLKTLNLKNRLEKKRDELIIKGTREEREQTIRDLTKAELDFQTQQIQFMHAVNDAEGAWNELIDHFHKTYKEIRSQFIGKLDEENAKNVFIDPAKLFTDDNEG